MLNVPDKSCRENQSTLFVFSSFFKKNPAIYKIMQKNIVEHPWPHDINGTWALHAG